MDNDDMKLIVECSDSIEFHYGDRCSVIIVDNNVINFIKEQTLNYIKLNFK